MFPFLFAHEKKLPWENPLNTITHTPVKCGYTHTVKHDIFLFLTWSTKEKFFLQCRVTHTLREKFSFCMKLKKKKDCRVCEVKKCIIFVFFCFLFNVVVDTTTLTFPTRSRLSPHGLSYSLRLTRPDRDPVEKKAGAAAAVARRLNCPPPFA
jgi:hypothetical protein